MTQSNHGSSGNTTPADNRSEAEMAEERAGKTDKSSEEHMSREKAGKNEGAGGGAKQKQNH